MLLLMMSTNEAGVKLLMLLLMDPRWPELLILLGVMYPSRPEWSWNDDVVLYDGPSRR